MKDVLIEDLEDINGFSLPWSQFYKSTVLITGATGLVGSLLVNALHYISEKRALEIKLIIIVRDKTKAKKMFRELNLNCIEGDIRQPICMEDNVDYIVHCAAITKSKDMICRPIETIQTAIYGTDRVLQFAVEKKVKSMVYLSSMEVYGVTDSKLLKVTEQDLGYVDLTNVRSSYPEGKRMCELLCTSYYSEHHVPVKIARLTQIFGAGVSSQDNRIFAQFVRSVLLGQEIVLHTDGSSTGNYCYTSDMIKAVLLLLIKGLNGEAYNVVNEENNYTIKQMAEMVAREIAHGQISIKVDTSQGNVYGYAPSVKMRISSEKLEALGWKPTYGLADMYKRMIRWLV